MAVFTYKAVTTHGKVVSGRIEEVSKQKLLEKLRVNNLTPITVNEQKASNIMKYIMPKQKSKRNKVSSVSVTKLAREKLLADQQKQLQKGLSKSIDIDLSFLERIKKEDIIAFTQSLFLLKRANFTNTRALATLLENTDKKLMKDINIQNKTLY